MADSVKGRLETTSENKAGSNPPEIVSEYDRVTE